MSIAHLDPSVVARPSRRARNHANPHPLPRPVARTARPRGKPTPGWVMALGVVVYCGCAWTLVVTAGAQLWEHVAPKPVFAASHRG